MSSAAIWDDLKLTLETLTNTSYKIHSNGNCLGVLYLHEVDKVYRFKPTGDIDLGLDDLNLIQTKIRQLNWLILNPKSPYK